MEPAGLFYWLFYNCIWGWAVVMAFVFTILFGMWTGWYIFSAPECKWGFSHIHKRWACTGQLTLISYHVEVGWTNLYLSPDIVLLVHADGKKCSFWEDTFKSAYAYSSPCSSTSFFSKTFPCTYKVIKCETRTCKLKLPSYSSRGW